MLLISIWYFFHSYLWPRPWPQPPEIGLGLVALASASRFLASFNITGDKTSTNEEKQNTKRRTAVNMNLQVENIQMTSRRCY